MAMGWVKDRTGSGHWIYMEGKGQALGEVYIS